MNKTMKARYAGRCSCCGAAFEAGAEIVYNGQATLADCVARERAELAREDAETAARYARDLADYKAGKFTQLFPGDKELLVTGAPSYEDAKIAALATAASIVAAGGRAKILTHRRNGKVYCGREIVKYYGMSTLGHHEGWSFRWAVETA